MILRLALAITSSAIMTGATADRVSAQVARGNTPRAQQKPAEKRPASAPSTWTGGVSGRSSMDDSVTVVYRLPAENVMTGWLAKERPLLIARCKEKETDLYIVWGTPAQVENGDTRTLRLRIDSAAAETDCWYGSTDDKALFATDPIESMKKLNGARTLRIECTPFNSSPQVATFDVRGFERPMKHVAQACAWEQHAKEEDAEFRRPMGLAPADAPKMDPVVVIPSPDQAKPTIRQRCLTESNRQTQTACERAQTNAISALWGRPMTVSNDLRRIRNECNKEHPADFVLENNCENERVKAVK